ncbi:MULTISPECIES: ComEC/Rec2 family competence protein [Chryseobacterium]|uniref:ComEC/Rec2 family competence protein n=1 Tax=Chryseobacterium TaxID=59732 RepID=UPI001E5CA1BB|nr:MULTISPECIES: ComEC/Rec2 family competence protein [Chryseobacterium]MDR6922114.1 competence protein ComEC [Chryseobacterium sp. 2987]
MVNKQPILTLTVCFILGIFFQDHFLLSGKSVYFVISGCILILILNFFHSYWLHQSKPVLLGLMFFGVAVALHFFNTFQPQKYSFSSSEAIVFKISKKLNSTEKNKKYEAEAQVGNRKLSAVIYIPKKNNELDFKHYYKAEAYISKPEPPPYDFQFNYAAYLKRNGIEYQCYISREVSSSVRNDLTFAEKIKQQRLHVLKKIDHAEMSGKTREFLKGMILADRTETDLDTVQDFSRSGLVHFLAISGTHVIVIFGIFYFLFTRFCPLYFRKYVVVISLLFIWLFAGFIGFGNSVVRSCIMLSVYFVYVLLQRKPDLLHSLSLSALIILCLDTQQIFDVGFQLSFLAVLGIFWLNQPLLRYFPKQDHYLKKLLFNTVTLSLSAQLATLPLVLYYFHQFSLISFPANILIVPFSEFVIVFSFLMTILITLQLDFTLLNVIYDFFIDILLKVIHWFAKFESLFYTNIPMNVVEVFLLFVMVYMTGVLLRKYSLGNGTRLLAVMVVFFIFRTGCNVYESQRSEILFYKVNQSRIFSIKKGNKVEFWISESSEKEKIRKFIINPYCSSRRVRSFNLKTFPMTTGRIEYEGEIYDLK